MDRFKLNKQLNPAITSATWFSDLGLGKNKLYGAFIIGTNGEYSFASPKVLFDTIEKLDEHLDFDVMGVSNYVLIFNDEEIMNINGDKYFIGSAFVVKMGETCLELVSEDEVDSIIELFGSRMIDIKLGCNQTYSAYELS